jgi:predicted TIM-barrel fold metal-dependent hydrolase
MAAVGVSSAEGTGLGQLQGVFDADTHVLEPPEFWAEYLDPEYRDRAPQFVVGDDGKERLLIEGILCPAPPAGLGTGGDALARRDGPRPDMSYRDGQRGGFEPRARIVDLELEGVARTALFPTLGLMTSGLGVEPAYAAALSRAYNRWLADYCSVDRSRLVGVAMTPIQRVDLAIQELAYAREELAMTSAFLRPNPYAGTLLSDPSLDPLWDVARDLDVSIAFHEGTGGMPFVGADRVVGRGMRHIVSHSFEMMLAALHLIWGGVCERYPELRFGFFESGGGWAVPWLDRMDRHYEEQGDQGWLTPLTVHPSEYFRRQCWISFEPPETTIAFSAERLGATHVMWASDYPHPDGFFPGATERVLDQLPAELRSAVMVESAALFFKS